MKSKHILPLIIAGIMLSLFISSCTSNHVFSGNKTSNISNITIPMINYTPTQKSNQTSITNNSGNITANTTTKATKSGFQFTIDCTKETATKCFASSDTKQGWALGLVDKSLVSSIRQEFNISNSTQIISLSNNSINRINIKSEQESFLKEIETNIGSEVLSFSNSIRSLVSSNVIDTTNSLNSGVQYLKIANINRTYLWNFSYGKSNSDLTTILISFNGTKILG